MRFGFSHLRTDGPTQAVPRGLAQVCLRHASEGGSREAATRNEAVPDPRCVCRVAGGRRVQLEAMRDAADDLAEIARRLRSLAAPNEQEGDDG